MAPTIKNTLLEKLQAGKPTIGVSLTFFSPTIAELVGYAGFDFMRIDCEHGPMDVVSAEHMIRAAELSGVTPIVRPPTNQPWEILRLLDAGALGVLAPGCETVADVERAAKAVRYYPEGERGLAGVRWSKYGAMGSLSDAIKMENREMFLIALIESVRGIENLDEMLKVPGLDAVAIGPNDLSQTMGMPSLTSRQEVQDNIFKVVDKAKAAGKYVHLVCSGTPEDAIKLTERGVDIVELNATAMFMGLGKSYTKLFQ